MHTTSPTLRAILSAIKSVEKESLHWGHTELFWLIFFKRLLKMPKMHHVDYIQVGKANE